jgi:hypothetical protein
VSYFLEVSIGSTPLVPEEGSETTKAKEEQLKTERSEGVFNFPVQGKEVFSFLFYFIDVINFMFCKRSKAIPVRRAWRIIEL